MPEVFKGDFSKGYDVVLHNHCQVKFQDDDAIDKVIDNHIKNKVPAVSVITAVITKPGPGAITTGIPATAP